MIRTVLAAAVVIAVTLVGTPTASALEQGPFSLEVLVDGTPLVEHAARGRSYVEAVGDREYSIRLVNRSDSRIAVALAVDGLNTIDARSTTALAAAKWILGPRDTILLDGWQTGPQTARRFFFTTEERSYGAWLGRTDGLGVISAAVFRERRPPLPIQAPHGAREEGQRRDSARLRGAEGAPEPGLDDDLAATGIGRELDHRVRRVAFDAEPTPAARLELRYEYRDALVRLDVLPRPDRFDRDALERREDARGFTDDGFAPDPFRARPR